MKKENRARFLEFPDSAGVFLKVLLLAIRLDWILVQWKRIMLILIPSRIGQLVISGLTKCVMELLEKKRMDLLLKTELLLMSQMLILTLLEPSYVASEIIL